MLYRTRQKLGRAEFHWRTRKIWDTPPLDVPEGGLRVVSMVCHRDVAMLTLAAKSFLRRLGRGRLMLIDDGSLNVRDKERRREHLRPEAIVPIAEVPVEGFPRGGTWERLLFILDQSRDRYVIQLDADTLTLGDVDEVSDAVEANRSFALGTSTTRDFTSVAEAAAFMEKSSSLHVQALAEKAMNRLAGAEGLRYVRGCSGFAGFAKGAFDRKTCLEFSRQMTSMLGKKWTEWGSEQVSSNFMIANAPQPVLLPFPKYSDYHPKRPQRNASFLHFLGPFRWKSGKYARDAEAVLGTF